MKHYCVTILQYQHLTSRTQAQVKYQLQYQQYYYYVTKYDVQRLFCMVYYLIKLRTYAWNLSIHTNKNNNKYQMEEPAVIVLRRVFIYVTCARILCTRSKWNTFISRLLVSTYVVCERLSVMHEPAGVVEILVQNPQNTPYSEVQFQHTPP